MLYNLSLIILPVPTSLTTTTTNDADKTTTTKMTNNNGTKKENTNNCNKLSLKYTSDNIKYTNNGNKNRAHFFGRQTKIFFTEQP